MLLGIGGAMVFFYWICERKADGGWATGIYFIGVIGFFSNAF
jgi:hypothetical protein